MDHPSGYGFTIHPDGKSPEGQLFNDRREQRAQ